MEKVKLGNILHIKHGFAFKGDYFTSENTGKIVLTPGNFSLKGGFQKSDKYTKEENFPSEYILKPGDLIVTMTDLSKEIDTIGFSALIPNDEKIYLHNQRIGLVTIKDDNYDCEYIYWLMRTKHYQRSIANTSNGATVHHTSPNRIYKYQFDKISLPLQRRIASILSAYDNLIEANSRRIKILEQMAENLYKEWFVRFRFPNYQNTPIENGIPKGWKVERLKDFGITLTSGSRPKGGIDANLEEGVPSLGAESIKGLAEFDYSSVKLVPQEFYCQMKRGKNTGNDILLYKDGAYIGKTTLFRDGFPFKTYSINEHVFIISPIDQEYKNYLYFTLHQEAFFYLMQNLNRNAAQPGLSNNDINNIKVMIPNKELIAQYNLHVEPILKEIFKLAHQSANLTRQRDLLLPRLMSGQLTPLFNQ